jgi:hypothetical protein
MHGACETNNNAKLMDVLRNTCNATLDLVYWISLIRAGVDAAISYLRMRVPTMQYRRMKN